MPRVILSIAIMLVAPAALAFQTPDPTQQLSREVLPRFDSRLGNGVDAPSGAFLLERPVARVQGLRPLEFSMSYNSALSQGRGDLGFGWSHLFEARLSGDPHGVVTIHWDANRSSQFQAVDEGGFFSYTPLQEEALYSVLTRRADGDWRLLRQDGTRFQFGPEGRLQRVGNKVRQFVELERNKGRLVRLREPFSDQSLTFGYNRHGLIQTVQDALERVFFLEYDGDQRLVSVHDPVQFEDLEDTFFIPINIPDDDPAGAAFVLPVSRSGPVGLVRLPLANLSHSRPQDLIVTLVSPLGTRALIHDRQPFVGPLVLDGRVLGDFQGEESEGNWTLEAVDTRPGISGTINGVMIDFSGPTDHTRYSYDSEALQTQETSVLDQGLEPILFSAVPGNIGETFSFVLRTTTAGPVVGSDLYTGDTGIGRAAVHAGLVLTGESQPVTVTILPGQSTYLGTARNGVTSQGRNSAEARSYAIARYLPAIQADIPSRIVRGADSQDIQLFANLFDEDGRVVEQDDGREGNQIAEFTYVFEAGGVQTTYRDRMGAQSVVTHDGEFRLLDFTDPVGNRSSWAYDQNGNRIGSTNPLGQVTSFVYDQRGNVVQATDPSGAVTQIEYSQANDPIRITDPLGKTSEFQWDNNSNMRRVTDALGNEDTRDYGGASQLLNSLLEDGGGMDLGFSGGMLSSVSHPAEPGQQTATHDEAGRLIKAVDLDGFETLLEYDLRDDVVKETDPLGHTRTFVYDYRGRLVGQTDARGNSATLAYDNNDNLVRVTGPDGNSRTFEYDGEDRLVKSINGQGGFTRHTYDAAGRRIGTRDSEGGGNSREYDAAGNEVAVFDYAGNLIRKSTYDVRGFQVRLEDGLGNLTLTEYDAAGRLVSMTDPTGQAVQWEYDALDRAVAVVDSRGRSSRELTTDDRPAALVDPAGNSTTFTYDNANRLTRIRRPDGFTRVVYNKRDLVEREESVAGRRREYTYDGAGRVVEARRTSLIGPGSEHPVLVYEYDEVGNQLEVATATADFRIRLTREFDENNRMTAYIDGEENRLEYQYDGVGNLTRLRYPDGRAVSYHYDTVNRLRRVIDWEGRETSYQYDGDHQITRIDFPNGTRRQIQYDQLGNVVFREDRDAQGDRIVSYRYSLDPSNRVETQTSEFLPAAYTSPNVSMTYGPLNRLATYNGQPVQFDRDGNLISGPLGSSQVGFSYDAEGNLVQVGTTQYRYDLEDRLITVVDQQGITRLVVDPSGALPRVLQMSAPSSEPVQYVYGMGLAYEVKGDAIRVHHYDQQGSTVAFSDSQGEVAGRVAYGPFGEILATQGDSQSLFLFNGLFGVQSHASGLNYMRFRWYSPQIKRFLSQDAHIGEIGESGSLNRYAFAGNNPVSFADPRGEFPTILAGALVGAAVGAATELVISAVERRPVDWAAVGGAAIGGAVTGAILFSPGGAAILSGNSLGATIGIAAAAGFAGGAAESASSQLLGGTSADDLNLEAILKEGAGQAIVGGVTGGIGSQATNRVLRRASRRLFRAGWKGSSKRVAQLGRLLRTPHLPRITRYQTSRSTNRIFLRFFVRRLEVKLALGAAFGLGGASATGAGDSGRPRTSNSTIRAIARSEVNPGVPRTFGEFAHWQLYVGFLHMASRPAQNNPNTLFANF